MPLCVFLFSLKKKNSIIRKKFVFLQSEKMTRNMPKISEFFGIRIEIRFLDHNPPHFHAKYQTDKVSIGIKDGKVKGEMSERALRLVLEWLELHRDDLMTAWKQAANGIDPDPIEPLK